jgi:type III pantothenate kinase
MSDRALLFDVGNTRLKWGVLEGDTLVRTSDIRHTSLVENGFSKLATRLPRRVGAVLASNVIGPEFAARLSRFIGIHCGCELRFARSEREAFGVTNGYKRPRQLGVDRWAAMIGARAEFKTALCIVDAGSAVTIDAMDRHGQHLGGEIIPGLHLMSRSLIRETSGISKLRSSSTELGTGMTLLADSTERAVQAGALNAICGAIERTVKIMRAEKLRPRIVLTGGGASPILKQLNAKVAHRPHLVLQGLATMQKSKV